MIAILPLQDGGGRSLAAFVGLSCVCRPLIAESAARYPRHRLYEMHLEALKRFYGGGARYLGRFATSTPTPMVRPGLVVDGACRSGTPTRRCLVFALAGDVFGDFRVGFLAAGRCSRRCFSQQSAARARAPALSSTSLLPPSLRDHQSWTEPVFVLGLAAVLLAAARRPRALPRRWRCLGTKQYAALHPAATAPAPRSLPRDGLKSSSSRFSDGGAVPAIPRLDPVGFVRSSSCTDLAAVPDGTSMSSVVVGVACHVARGTR